MFVLRYKSVDCQHFSSVESRREEKDDSTHYKCEGITYCKISVKFDIFKIFVMRDNL